MEDTTRLKDIPPPPRASRRSGLREIGIAALVATAGVYHTMRDGAAAHPPLTQWRRDEAIPASTPSGNRFVECT